MFVASPLGIETAQNYTDRQHWAKFVASPLGIETLYRS